MDEQDFRRKADDVLAKLRRALIEASDDYGFDVDSSGGALTVEFEAPGAKFVISPNAPVRQIWISAHAKSYKLDWDHVESAFVHSESGRTLNQVIETAISKQVGEEVEL